MRKVSIVSLCIIALAVFTVWASDVMAYDTWSGCQSCHGGFRTTYTSMHDGKSWGSNLHDVHRNTMLSGNCDTCHIGSNKTPVYMNKSNGGTGFPAIGCVGCHGRADDVKSGAGLRQHHYQAGETVCLGCHNDANPANYKTVSEKTAPPYYFTPDATHLSKPTSSCNDSGKENFAASTAGLDNDGDGLYDAADPDCQAAACIDADGDGYGSNGAAACAKGAAVDCKDNDPAVNPGAADNICNGIDENCSGTADEGYVPTSTQCGKGICASTGQSTCQGGKLVDTCTAGTPQTEGPSGDATCSDSRDNDCDGTTDAADSKCASVCVPTTEVCDGQDNDCDGQVDEGIASTPTTCGVGSCASTGQSTCQGGKMVDTCSAGTPQTEGPSGSSTCSDSQDNNCNGQIDAAEPNCASVCVPTTEVCDGKDNDCDGQVDEDATKTYYRDADRDGYGAPSVSKQSCKKPSGYVKDNTDCDDSNKKIHPDREEKCDGADNNCNGDIDEGVRKTYYRDADGDRHGDPSVSIQECRRPSGYVKNNNDCNDSNRKVHKGTAEICGNQVDQSCNDIIDCSNPACYTNPACSNPEDKDHEGDDDHDDDDGIKDEDESDHKD